MALFDDSWTCKSCTFVNNKHMDICEICKDAKPKLWQCLKCTFLNDPDNQTCSVCGASSASKLTSSPDTIHDEANNNENMKEEKQPPSHNTHMYNENKNKWLCSKCTFANTTDVNECIICTQINSCSVWKCTHCTTINPLDSDKICSTCDHVNTDKYWKCNKCTFINNKNDNNCIMCTQHTQLTQLTHNNTHLKPQLSNVAVFVPFIADEHKNKTITVTLSRDNMIQRQHFNDFKDIVHELNTSALCINAAFMEKQLDSNKCEFVMIFIDVIQELAQYLKKHNETILQEIKLAIECQTYEPTDNECKAVEPIWGHVNQFVLGLFETANEFLSLRDEFVLVLMDIMWKSNNFNIEQCIIEKLKKNIQIIKNDELKMNENDFDDKVFQCLNKIREILPGQTYFASLLENIPRKADEYNECNNELNAKIEEYNTVFEQRKQQIESKKAQIAIKRNVLEQDRLRFERANDGSNYDYAKTLSDQCNALQTECNKMVDIVNEDIRKSDQFTDNFQHSVQPLTDERVQKERECNRMVDELKETRRLLGMKGDNLIGEFLEKMNELTPLSISIYSRMVQFEVLISTLSELLIRGMDDEKQNDLPTIESYFVQSQIRLHDFVKPLNDMDIYTIDDFKNMYKGKRKLFKKELIPHLEQALNRKIKLGEIRRLRSICQANKKK